MPRLRPVSAACVIAVLLTTLGATPRMTRAAGSEIEPNNTAATATALTAIGLDNPITGAIDTADDTDYYSFTAVRGRTYTVEVFAAAGSLGVDGNYNCTNVAGLGLGILIYDAVNTLPVVDACIARQNGSGVVHNIAVLQPTASGTYFIRLLHNNSAATGAYQLRVLPGYNDPGASWTSDFEPNDVAPNAYLLPMGRSAALTSSFVPAAVDQSATTPDIDWYRFAVVSGREYTVEVFDVASSLSDSAGERCDSFGRTRRGVWLTITKGDQSEVTRVCVPDGAGNVHTLASFKASETGTYYARVQPHGIDGAGSYRIRLLPKFDQPGADWDAATFEPNNTPTNAYLLPVGRANALRSAISGRSDAFATTTADQDWFRFTAVQGTIYTVAVLNVDPALAAGAGSACDSFGRTTRGLILELYQDNATGITINDQIARACDATNAQGVHTSDSFTAAYSGIYYAHILPNDATTAGNYTVRVTTPSDFIRVFMPLLRR